MNTKSFFVRWWRALVPALLLLLLTSTPLHASFSPDNHANLLYQSGTCDRNYGVLFDTWVINYMGDGNPARAGTLGINCSRFDGLAGDRIVVIVQPPETPMTVQMFRPDGTTVCAPTINVLDCVLDVSGEHLFTVSGGIQRDPPRYEPYDILVQRNPSPETPFIDSIDLQQQKVSNLAWETVPANGTVDGNRVRIIVNIANGDPSQDIRVYFSDIDTFQSLHGQYLVLDHTKAAFEWDTTGYAWNGAVGQTQRNILIELWVGGVFITQEIQAIKVRPKPVILVHGFISNTATWTTYKNQMEAYNADWQGYAVGQPPNWGVMNTGFIANPRTQTNTILQNAAILDTYIENVRRSENAWRVDVVGHSMGGLITREYVHTFMRSRSAVNGILVNNFVMLGTPNMGALWANDVMTVEALGIAAPYMPALNQLTPVWVQGIFNPTHPLADLNGINVFAVGGTGHFSGGGEMVIKLFP